MTKNRDANICVGKYGMKNNNIETCSNGYHKLSKNIDT